MLFYYNMKGDKISKKILVIGGPTGIGKSRISFEVALRVNGEIISADSMQFYREIDIGTDKVSAEMREKVPHYLIDCLSLRDSFDVHTFLRKTIHIVNKILLSGRVPIIVGGSGLYLRSLMNGIFPIPKEKMEKQNGIRKLLSKKNLSVLYSELKSVDIEAASRIHKNDRKRITRALEVYLLTGKTISYWHRQNPKKTLADVGDPLYFILTRNREVMYNRIDERVDAMFESGWIQEVKNLEEKGFRDILLYKSPIGYVEILDFLDGKYTMDELKSIIKKRTRTLARKQLTWFKKEKGIWLDIEEDENKAVEIIIEKFTGFEGGK